jgi:LPS sulfotransferase NodH
MQICLFLSKPRSGATVLRQALGAHPEIFDFGEVFNEVHTQSFFHFNAGMFASDPQWAYPSRSRALFRAYVEACKAKAALWKPSARIVVFDVKYDHFCVVQNAWHGLRQRPALLDEALANDWSIIHLVRNDALACVMSNLYAQSSGVYHVERNGAPPEAKAVPKPIRVNVRNVCHLFRELRWEIGMVDCWLGSLGNVCRLEYEVLFDPDGDFSAAVTQRLASFLRVESPIDTSPRLSKVISGDPLSLVENRDDLAAALSSLTDFVA